jgi:hypothetical protein
MVVERVAIAAIISYNVSAGHIRQAHRNRALMATGGA